MIVCFQYKVAGFNLFFTPEKMNGDSYGTEDEKGIIWLAKCICAWKIKVFSKEQIHSINESVGCVFYSKKQQ